MRETAGLNLTGLHHIDYKTVFTAPLLGAGHGRSSEKKTSWLACAVVNATSVFLHLYVTVR